MTTATQDDPCTQFWRGFRSALERVTSGGTRRSGGDLGHGGGVDDDAVKGQTDAQEAARQARQAGGDHDADSTTGTCPLCKVAIVVGHSSRSGGAYSSYIGENEWNYNHDIAQRTISKIEALSDGKISAQIFFRTTGGGYTAEMRAAYAPVNAYLQGVPAAKKIAFELHFNSINGSANYALVLYDRNEGRSGFAQKAANKMGAIYGSSRRLIKHYGDNPTGHGGFNYGPPNTFLMEPFFGSDERSANIAKTEAGRDQLAQVYAELLVEWVG